MARLIDANALAVTYCDIDNRYNSEPWDLQEILLFLNDAPTVDAVEVVHGRWVKTENGIRQNINTGEMVMAYMHDCSVCGWHTGNQGRNFNYCPNCGARMDGERKDNGI